MKLPWLATSRLNVLADRLLLQPADARDAPAKQPVSSQAMLSQALQAAACTDALADLLRDAGGVRRVDIVVQAAWARLLVLPDNPALHAEKRWAGYASSRFEALTGEAAEAWVIRVLPEPPGRPRLMVALPAALMRVLNSAFGAKSGRQLRSVRVDALGRLDALRAREARFSGAAVEGSERHLLLSLFERGVLQRVRQRRSAVDADELQAMLRVEWAALGHDGPLPVLALGPGLPPGPPWSALARRTLVLS